jgi:hypothetical protein
VADQLPPASVLPPGFSFCAVGSRSSWASTSGGRLSASSFWSRFLLPLPGSRSFRSCLGSRLGPATRAHRPAKAVSLCLVLSVFVLRFWLSVLYCLIVSFCVLRAVPRLGSAGNFSFPPSQGHTPARQISVKPSFSMILFLGFIWR